MFIGVLNTPSIMCCFQRKLGLDLGLCAHDTKCPVRRTHPVASVHGPILIGKVTVLGPFVYLLVPCLKYSTVYLPLIVNTGLKLLGEDQVGNQGMVAAVVG